MEFDKLINKAAKQLAEMNASERAAGFMPDEEGPVSMRLRTVEMAMEAGMKIEDWELVAQAYLMLKAINKKIYAKGN